MRKGFEKLGYAQEQLCQVVAGKLLRWQDRLARWSNGHLARMAIRRQRMLLYAICCILGIYFLTVALLAMN